jgi:hypothetical protein
MRPWGPVANQRRPVTLPAPPIFSATASSVAPVALSDRQSQGASSFPVLVSLTITASVVYTDVRCICNRRVMSVPGVVAVEVRVVKSDADRSGRGRVLSCKRCSSLLEVIEHG